MKILSAQQVRDWDAYTTKEQEITSLALMERAATACVDWVLKKYSPASSYSIYCGRGNNGGDGLAIARLLHQKGFTVIVRVLSGKESGSPDFEANLQRLAAEDVAIASINDAEKDVADEPRSVVIDALFGLGLNRPLTGLAKTVVEHINASAKEIVAIDFPSGLQTDKSSKNQSVIKATHTLTFQCYKLALLIQENAEAVGDVHVLDIGLSQTFLNEVEAKEEWMDEAMILRLFKPRPRFSHKGKFGHALIAGGSQGKIGSVLLATKSCLAAGAGLTTTYTPGCGYNIIQSGAPEAMAITDENETHLGTFPGWMGTYTVVGLGPGMDIIEGPQRVLAFMLKRCTAPMVIDADGLNCLSLQKELLTHLKPDTILTPHPKEFDRLFGDHQNDFDRMATAKQKAIELKIIIVLKGHHTMVALPNGRSFFNSTGNAGMAKGGSGDVLTGIITALLAQQYKPEEAARFGVYIHGWAGDFAAKKFSKQALLPSHIIEGLTNVFLELERK